jgi:hypothetical protein
VQRIAEAQRTDWTYWSIVLLCVVNAAFGLLEMQRTSPVWFGLLVAMAAMALLVSLVTDRLKTRIAFQLVVVLNMVWLVTRSWLHGYLF